MKKMTTTTTITTTTDPSLSSAYDVLNKDGRMVCLIDNNGKLAHDIYIGDADVDSSINDLMTKSPERVINTVPRHGELVDSVRYLPPVFIFLRYGYLVPYLIFSPLGNANKTLLQFVQSSVRSFKVSSRLWMIRAMLTMYSESYASLSTSANITALLSTIGSMPILLQSPTFITNFSVSARYNGDVAIGTLSVAVAATVVLLVDGNITITSITPPDTGLNIIIIATGSVNIIGATPVIDKGDLIIIAGGLINYGTAATSVNDNLGNVVLAAGNDLHINYSDSGTYSNKNVIYVGNKLYAPTVGTVDFSIDGTTSYTIYPAGSTYVRGFYDIISTGDTFSVNVTEGVSFYTIGEIPLSSSIDIKELGKAMNMLIAYQYNLPYESLKFVINDGTNNTPNNGSYEIRFVYDGCQRETQLVIEMTNPADPLNYSCPNFGIHTGPFNMENYTAGMLQTQRIGDNDVFIPVNGPTTCFMYNIISGITRAEMIDFSLPPFDLQSPIKVDGMPSDYRLTKFATYDMTTPRPTTQPTSIINNEGGMVPFDNDWSNKYVRLSLTDQMTGAVRIKAPYTNSIKYFPFGGYITGVTNTDGATLNKGVVTIKNPSKRAQVYTATVNVKPSLYFSLLINYNAASHTNTARIVYADDDKLVVLLPVNGVMEFIELANGVDQTIEGVKYNWSASTSVISAGTNNTTLTKISTTPNTATVVVNVLFGDMVGTPTVTKIVASNEYLYRTVDGLAIAYVQNILGSTNTVDVSLFTNEEIDALISSGFTINGNTATRFTSTTVPNTSTKRIIFKSISLLYRTTDTTIKVPLVAGSYIDSVSGENIIVSSDNTILTRAAPFNIGYNTYIPTIDTSAVPVSNIGGSNPPPDDNDPSPVPQPSPYYQSGSIDLADLVILLTNANYLTITFSNNLRLSHKSDNDRVVLDNVSLIDNTMGGYIDLQLNTIADLHIKRFSFNVNPESTQVGGQSGGVTGQSIKSQFTIL